MAETTNSLLPELPPDYYLQNVKTLLEFVWEHHASLLNQREQLFFQHFNQFDDDAQKLYVRMLLRKGQFFRIDKLNYKEIYDIESAATSLEENGFAFVITADTLEHHLHSNDLEPHDFYGLLKLFTKSELVECFHKFELSKFSRDELDNFLLSLDFETAIQQLFDFSRVHIIACQLGHFFETFKLLFFGNLHQDMTDFVLRDLGMYEYEDYELAPEYAAINSRDLVDLHLKYYEYVALEEFVEKGNPSAISDFLNTFLVEMQPANVDQAAQTDAIIIRRKSRLVYRWARQLERISAVDEALHFYSIADTDDAVERTIRLRFELAQYDEGFGMLESFLERQSVLNEDRQFRNTTQAFKEFCMSFAPRQIKKISKHLDQSEIAKLKSRYPMSFDLPANKRFTPVTEDQVLNVGSRSVEIETADHFQQFGDCYYVENALVNSVLGLLFWDVVFAPIKGAFFNPFQYRPADLFDDFVEVRESLIKAVWNEVDSQQVLLERLLSAYHAKYGVANPFVYWGAIDESLLTIASERIPLQVWKTLIDRIFADIKSNRTGLPDLIFFPEDGAYEFIEVKGPGDKPQANQLRWMRYFNEHNIPYRMLNITWAD